MKKHYIFKFILLFIPISAFLLMSSSGGRTDARSGSPGDNGSSCTACHTGGSSGVSADITSDIPNEGYALNTEYTITVDKSSSAAGGFQLVAENDSNQKVGSFTAGSGTKIDGSGNRITHSNSNNSSWSFKWTSPASDLGNIKFYASVVVANGDGNNGSADKAINVSTAGASVLSTSNANLLDFDMYPNPASQTTTIQIPTGSEKATVQFYDYSGKLVLNQNITNSNNKVNVQNLSTGVYLLKVISENKIGTQKFIKK